MHVFVCAQPVVSAQPSPQGKHVVAVSDTGNILIYDVPTLNQTIPQVYTMILCFFSRSNPYVSPCLGLAGPNPQKIFLNF